MADPTATVYSSPMSIELNLPFFPQHSLCLNACEIGVPSYQAHKNAIKDYCAKSVRIISDVSNYSLVNETQTETIVLIYHSVQARKLTVSWSVFVQTQGFSSNQC